MKSILSYVKKYRIMVAGVMLIKLSAALAELLLPNVLEHLVDNVAPVKDARQGFAVALHQVGLRLACIHIFYS